MQQIQAVIHATDFSLTHTRHIDPIFILPDLQIAVLRLYQILRSSCCISPTYVPSTLLWGDCHTVSN